MQANVVQLGARCDAANPSKNLKAALNEAAQMHTVANRTLLVAQVAAQSDWDASESIAKLQDELRAMQRQLDFAATLSMRRNRLRQPVAEGVCA